MSLQSYQTPTTTTMDPTKVVLGSLAFAVFWVLAVFPAVPLLPIGRTAGSLLAAILMVIFQVISPTQAYASIDLSILGLLFGTMVVSVYLDRADAFKYLGMLLSWKSQGGKDLICRVCLISAVTSAFFTNDTSCIVLTEFVLKVARQNNLPPLPFLLALASSANIGSSATPIGNPQNLVIATDSGISFWDFLVGMLPAVLIGASLNAALLLCMYWKQLSSCYHDDGDEENISGGLLGEDGNDTGFCQLSLQTLSSSDAQEWSSRMEVQRYSYVNLDLTRFGTQSDHQSEGIRNQEEWKRVLRKSCVYFVTVGMMIALVLGMNMSWTAITAALVLVIVYFKDAQPCLEKVSYSLLIFFCGMFMTIDGFNETGIPKSLWEVVEPYSRIDTAGGVAVAACVILILCNLISNVPTVMLMGGYMAASAGRISPEYVKKAWLTLAWVSTVAGNLSLVGSAANMIVCEKACRVHHLPFNLSFWSHLKFGLPSTLIVTAVGLTLIA